MFARRSNFFVLPDLPEVDLRFSTTYVTRVKANKQSISVTNDNDNPKYVIHISIS